MLNSVHCGDCLQLLPKVPSGSIDLVLCDLPYGMTHNKWDKFIPIERLWAEYKRVLRIWDDGRGRQAGRPEFHSDGARRAVLPDHTIQARC
jgi:DNA modification methylase